MCVCVHVCESFANEGRWTVMLRPEGPVSQSEELHRILRAWDPGNQKELNRGLVSLRFCCLSSEQLPYPWLFLPGVLW